MARRWKRSSQHGCAQGLSCLVAEHCWDPVGLAIVEYAYRFERLTAAAPGFQAVLLETRHVKAALSAMVVKTDRKDARGYCQLG